MRRSAVGIRQGAQMKPRSDVLRPGLLPSADAAAGAGAGRAGRGSLSSGLSCDGRDRYGVPAPPGLGPGEDLAALPALPAGADVLRAGPWGVASRSRACTPCVVVGVLL